MQHRNTIPAKFLLVIAIVALPILFFIDRHNQDTQEELEKLHQRIDELKYDLDSLKFAYRQLRKLARESEAILSESIDELEENWIGHETTFDEAFLKIEELRKQAAGLQDIMSERRHALESLYKAQKKMLLNNQHLFRKIRSEMGPAPL